MENIIIRQGEAKDLREIVQLMKELNDYQHYIIDSPDEKKLFEDGFSGEPLYHTLVAEAVHPDGVGEIVGVIAYAFSYFLTLGRTANMSGFFVKQEYRSRGIGKALYKSMLEATSKKNCVGVAFNTHKGNEGTIKFYKNFGAMDVARDLEFLCFWHFKEKTVQR